MTTLTDYPVDQLKAQAAAARPGRGLATLIGTVFVALGWVARLVTGVAFCGLATRYGYRLGRGRDPVTGAVARPGHRETRAACSGDGARRA